MPLLLGLSLITFGSILPGAFGDAMRKLSAGIGLFLIAMVILGIWTVQSTVDYVHCKLGDKVVCYKSNYRTTAIQVGWSRADWDKYQSNPFLVIPFDTMIGDHYYYRYQIQRLEYIDGELVTTIQPCIASKTQKVSLVGHDCIRRYVFKDGHMGRSIEEPEGVDGTPRRNTDAQIMAIYQNARDYSPSLAYLEVEKFKPEVVAR